MENKQPPRMTMDDEQRASAEKVREILNVQDFTDVFMAFDFADAMGHILNGVDTLAQPEKMKEAFISAWQFYALMWVTEYNATLRKAVVSDDLWTQVMEHPESREIGERLLDRIVSVDGKITKRMTVTAKVDDILAEYEVC